LVVVQQLDFDSASLEDVSWVGFVFEAMEDFEETEDFRYFHYCWVEHGFGFFEFAALGLFEG